MKALPLYCLKMKLTSCLRSGSCLLFALVFIWPGVPALAWGERGHDLIARLAVRDLIAHGDSKLYRPFQLREFMLGHLSNVPDIVWKADTMDERVRQLNGPTHYINLDLLGQDRLSLQDIPRDYKTLVALARKVGADAAVGSAPWRVAQLHGLMRSALQQAGQARTPAGRIKHTNAALLYGGIMAHFVGDLANPHHNVKDYDGWQSGNGGLHAYFESQVVNSLGLDLADKIFRAMQTSQLLDEELLGSYSEVQRRLIKNDALALSLALSINSHAQLAELLRLDDQYSLLARSNHADGKKERAKRRPAAAVAKHYAAFVCARLALGSAVLSQLWKLAWVQAGRPDLSAFHSFHYPLQPDFIYPDYLP